MNTKQQFDNQKLAIENAVKSSGYEIKKSGKFYVVYEDGKRSWKFNRYKSVFSASIVIVAMNRVMTRQEYSFVYDMPVSEKPTLEQYKSEQQIQDGKIIGLCYGVCSNFSGKFV